MVTFLNSKLDACILHNYIKPIIIYTYIIIIDCLIIYLRTYIVEIYNRKYTV